MARQKRKRSSGQSPDEPDTWPAFFAWLLRQGWLEFFKAVVLALIVIGTLEEVGGRAMTNVWSFIR